MVELWQSQQVLIKVETIHGYIELNVFSWQIQLQLLPFFLYWLPTARICHVTISVTINQWVYCYEIIIVVLVSHIDVVSRNSILEAWCQQDFFWLESFLENLCHKGWQFFGGLQYWSQFQFSQSTFFSFLDGVPIIPITRRISSSFMFHSFFSSLARSWYFSPFSFFGVHSFIILLTLHVQLV